MSVELNPVPNWQPSTNYNEETIVAFDGAIYISRTQQLGQPNPSVNNEWIQIGAQQTIPGGRLVIDSGSGIADPYGSGSGTLLRYINVRHNMMPVSNTVAFWMYETTKMIVASNTLDMSNTPSCPPDAVYDVYARRALGSGKLWELQYEKWASKTNRGYAISYSTVTGLMTRIDQFQHKVYLGSVYKAPVSGLIHDVSNARHLYNFYNQGMRELHCLEPLSNWTCSDPNWRIANNNTNNKISVLCGWEIPVAVSLRNMRCCDSPAGALAQIGIGVNGTTPYRRVCLVGSNMAGADMMAEAYYRCPLGLSTLYAVERATAGTVTFYGGAYGGLEGTIEN